MAEWEKPPRACNAQLTDRQREVLELVCLGKTNPEIGAILAISTVTVKNHVQDCRRKLQACNKVLLVAKYLAPDRFKK